MKRRSDRVSFDNGRHEKLAGIIEWPDEEPRAFVLFSHCFTCGKDLKAIVRISRELAARGMAVLRFDFTGLGDSHGDFAKTNFSTNCQDILAAAKYLEFNHRAPELLVGHSLGGTATTVVANQIQSCRAIATIASPSSTRRLAGVLEKHNPEIVAQGEAVVTIGGTKLTMRRQLIDNLREHDIEDEIARLERPILMFHSPADQTLPYEWGLRMFELATAPKSFVTLDGADHLLVNQEGDVPFVASMIDHWFRRYSRASD